MVKVLFVFSSFFISFSQICVWSRFYNEKRYFNCWFYISLVCITLFGLVNYFFVNAFLRMLVAMILFCIFNYLIFRKTINEVIVSVIYGHFLLALSDLICAVIVMVIFGVSSSGISDDMLLTSCGNFLISFSLLFISNFKFIRSFYLRLVSITSKFKFKFLFFVCVFIMVCINFFMANIYYSLNPIYAILINLCFILIYSFIIYSRLKEKNANLIIKSQNEYLMESLHQYEDMVDRQRVDNHENKNQLLIIKNMIDKKDKDLVKYINSIIKDKKEDDEVLYTRVKTIPSGGLQGIIYQKMLVMKDEKILFSLDVSRDVRNINLDSLSMDDNYKLCKIVGVLLDNAIEASRNIDDKCIMISLYIDEDELIIDISNRFNNSIDIDRIDDEGYTTKEVGHGYGLSLVKKIVSESDVFQNMRSVKMDIFKQVIKVKIKNT